MGLVEKIFGNGKHGDFFTGSLPPLYTPNPNSLVSKVDEVGEPGARPLPDVSTFYGRINDIHQNLKRRAWNSRQNSQKKVDLEVWKGFLGGCQDFVDEWGGQVDFWKDQYGESASRAIAFSPSQIRGIDLYRNEVNVAGRKDVLLSDDAKGIVLCTLGVLDEGQTWDEIPESFHRKRIVAKEDRLRIRFDYPENDPELNALKCCFPTTIDGATLVVVYEKDLKIDHASLQFSDEMIEALVRSPVCLPKVRKTWEKKDGEFYRMNPHSVLVQLVCS